MNSEAAYIANTGETWAQAMEKNNELSLEADRLHKEADVLLDNLDKLELTEYVNLRSAADKKQDESRHHLAGVIEKSKY